MAANIGAVEVDVELSGAAARITALDMAVRVMTSPNMQTSDVTRATTDMAKAFEQYLTGDATETPTT